MTKDRVPWDRSPPLMFPPPRASRSFWRSRVEQACAVSSRMPTESAWCTECGACTPHLRRPKEEVVPLTPTALSQTCKGTSLRSHRRGAGLDLCPSARAPRTLVSLCSDPASLARGGSGPPSRPGSALTVRSQDKARSPAFLLVCLEKMLSRDCLHNQCQDIPSFQLKRSASFRNLQRQDSLLFTPLHLCLPSDTRERSILSLPRARFLPAPGSRFRAGLFPRA